MHDEQNRVQQMSEDFQKMVDDFFTIQCRYSAAMREIQTKLEILDDEFQMRHKRNPIHHMQCRMKSIHSMMEKLRRKNYAVSMASAVENLSDIAGIRVICSYVEDVYTVARLLTSQDDIRLVETRDYIRQPKANGYRSLHLIVEVPVFLQDGRITVPVEVQIRTIAMDFWASLEHAMRYKAQGQVPEDICQELQQVGEDIAVLDKRMQSIHDRIDALTAGAENS
ncbi:MAG: GTP pyrophosphokinase family protein [Clostridia bacterium]|nr:GTP pyrophosphokinase family protein [Clostridia bacterium]